MRPARYGLTPPSRSRSYGTAVAISGAPSQLRRQLPNPYYTPYNFQDPSPLQSLVTCNGLLRSTGSPVRVGERAGGMGREIEGGLQHKKNINQAD